MNTTLFLSKTKGLKSAFRSLCLLAILMFAVTDVSAEAEVSFDQQYFKQVEAVGNSWDSNSNQEIIVSDALRTTFSSSPVAKPYGVSYVNYHLNGVSHIEMNEIDAELKAFSKSIEQIINEFNEAKSKNFKGEWPSLRDLVVKMDYVFQDAKPTITKNDFSFEKLASLTTEETETGLMALNSLKVVLDKVLASDWGARKKLLAYKYLAFDVANQPLLWKCMGPIFLTGAKAGGATIDAVHYRRLGADRLGTYAHDSYVWRTATRYYPNQLSTRDLSTGIDRRPFSKVVVTDKDTRVTLSYTPGGHDLWWYYDKSMVLIDNETNERYPIRSIEGGLPLSRSFVVVGCENKIMDITLVFAPLKKSVKEFYMDTKIVDCSFLQTDGNADYKSDVVILADYLK